MHIVLYTNFYILITTTLLGTEQFLGNVKKTKKNIVLYCVMKKIPQVNIQEHLLTCKKIKITNTNTLYLEAKVIKKV